MDAHQLYKRLEEDFIAPSMHDEWMEHMAPIADLVCEDFKERAMGLVCDFARDIQKVYTAVFPSLDVMQKILDEGTENAMLFVHHAAVWDIRNAPEVFSCMDRRLLEQFKEKGISVYNLHVPLDHYHSYGTSHTLAEALNLHTNRPFTSYFGALAGVFASTDATTTEELRERFSRAVGHEVSLYPYGDQQLRHGTVAVIAGGGNDPQMLEEIAREEVNTLITGITVTNERSRGAHEYAEQQGINILGGTHYSTEKFACIAMAEYFQRCGLSAEFVPDSPLMEDM